MLVDTVINQGLHHSFAESLPVLKIRASRFDRPQPLHVRSWSWSLVQWIHSSPNGVPSGAFRGVPHILPVVAAVSHRQHYMMTFGARQQSIAGRKLHRSLRIQQSKE